MVGVILLQSRRTFDLQCYKVLNLWTEKFTWLPLYFRSAQQSHFRDGGQAGQQEARQKGKSPFYVLSHKGIVTVLVKATVAVLWVRIVPAPDPNPVTDPT
jgi:hypothetical protein